MAASKKTICRHKRNLPASTLSLCRSNKAACRALLSCAQLQGLLYQDVEGPDPGLGALELQRSAEVYVPPGELAEASGEREALLGKPSGDGRGSPVISLTAHAGCAAPAVHWPPAPSAADVQLKLPLA